MTEYVIGDFINIFGSVAINFGTNLLKLRPNQRERLALQNNGGGETQLMPHIQFQTWIVNSNC
ncbi:BnaC03g75600D [Brassica napus]|uniref:BnaC03g75600D protein n=2 Tax=Brassica TaxID=3705 RepID=A0A078IRB1_BRANA|nr:BnaC03g75600D [Brassica napus]VDC97596.1 unnamed protein product [Brassica oleracea]